MSKKKKAQEELSTDPREFEVVFAEGCFDDFEGDQEELDEFVAAIKAAVKDGSLFDEAVPLTEDETEEGLKRGFFDISKKTKH